MEAGRISPTHSNFLPQFKAIGQGLKKRFFRKPNVADAIEQYNTLCQELKRDGQDEFAAVCAVEAAKCHESLQNHLEYANTLVKAANYYLQARDAQKLFEVDQNESPMNVSSRGKLELAMQYLGKAARVYKQQQSDGLALMTTLKMGQTLFQEEEYDESLKCYKTALEYASIFTLEDRIVIVDSIVTCKLRLTEMESAAKMVGDYLKKLKEKEANEEFPTDFILRFIIKFEVLRVCLLLILGSETTDLAKFIWPESSLPEDPVRNDKGKERQEMMVCLKSLVMAVEQGSMDEIYEIRDRLTSLVKDLDFELFSLLVTLYC